MDQFCYQQYYAMLIGLALSLVLSSIIVPLLLLALKCLIPVSAPNERIKYQWDKLVNHQTGGTVLGPIEVTLMFAGAYIGVTASIGGWGLIAAWLTMKTVFFWQNTNFFRLPDQPPLIEEAEYLVARLQLSNLRVSSALVGTAANLVFAISGAALAAWLSRTQLYV